MISVGEYSVILAKKPLTGRAAEKQRLEATTRAEEACSAVHARLVVLPPETNRTGNAAALVFACEAGPH